MHVLIIPSERYVTTIQPLQGIFQYDQAHALRRSGLEVGVIAPQPRSLRLMRSQLSSCPKGIEFENDEGIPVYRYHGWNWATGKFPYISTWFPILIGKILFKKYVANHGRPDIIHAHNVLYAGIIASFIKKTYHIQYIITEHSSNYAIGKIYRWQMPAMRDAFHNADMRFVVSDSLGKEIETQFGRVVSPWESIPNILDKTFEKICLPKIIKESPNRSFRFLNVSRLIEVKNHADLLKAFAYKFQGKQNIQLRIGGEGFLRKKLETLRSNLGLENQVIFLGSLNREQVLSEIQASDAFVLSSRYETFGVVLIEALACGKPVVATACGGPESIVHSENGILVPQGDIRALGDALENIFQRISRYDSERIRKDCLARFGEKAIVEKLTHAYLRVLS